VNSVYDTAWVFMVARKADGNSMPKWVFSECFEFLCSNEAADSGWENPISDTDRICCRLVSLLVVKKHLPLSRNLSEEGDLQSRTKRETIEFIQSKLPTWELNSLDATLPTAVELWLLLSLTNGERIMRYFISLVKTVFLGCDARNHHDYLWRYYIKTAVSFHLHEPLFAWKPLLVLSTSASLRIKQFWDLCFIRLPQQQYI
jgi:hypothetical protein